MKHQPGGGPRRGVEPAVAAKLEPALADALARAREDEIVKVMFVLVGENVSPPLTLGRKERAAEIQRIFKQETEDFVDELRRHGATDVELLWISHAVAARLPIGQVPAVAASARVKGAVLSVTRKVIASEGEKENE